MNECPGIQAASSGFGHPPLLTNLKQTHTTPQPAQTRVLHPITPQEEYRRPDAAALAAEGLAAKFAVMNLKTKQYKVTKVGGCVGFPPYRRRHPLLFLPVASHTRHSPPPS